MRIKITVPDLDTNLSIARPIPYDNHYDRVARICVILDKICKRCAMLNSAMHDKAILYGSIIWRVVHQIDPNLTDDEIIDIVLTRHANQSSDIDLFMEKEHMEGYRQSYRSRFIETNIKQYFLAYEVQNEQDKENFRAIQEILASGDSRNMYKVYQISRDTAYSHTNIFTSLSFQRILHNSMLRKVEFQMHFAKNPTLVLNKYAAPFLTPETLMYRWHSGEPLQCRFYDNLERILQDIFNGHMRIINSAEIEQYLIVRPSTMNLLKQRLIKYANYGFRLILSTEDLSCDFIHRMIETMHVFYVDPCNKKQRYYIAKNIPYHVEIQGNLLPSVAERLLEQEIKKRNNALAAQHLYQDYIASVMLSVVENMSINTAGLIAQYAARSSNDVYPEDKELPDELRAHEEWAERVRQAILRRLAGQLDLDADDEHDELD